MGELDAIPASRKTGEECIHESGRPCSIQLKDFWSWANSDLLDNRARGIFAEFLVATALGVAGGTRIEWDAKDLVTETGTRVEIKSAAYIQLWQQTDFTDIRFDIALKLGWDATTNEYSSQAERSCDVYVFCFLAEKDQALVDPLDLNQWNFYVLSTRTIDEELGNQKSLSLSTLIKLNPEITSYEGLAEAVERAQVSSSPSVLSRSSKTHNSSKKR